MPEKKHHHRADNISPEFARFLWEQQKNAQKPKEPIYPTTLAETSFYRGSPSILGSTFQSVSFAMPQTRVTLDSLTEGSVALQPISKTTSHSVNQDASPKATTPSPETAAVDVPV